MKDRVRKHRKGSSGKEDVPVLEFERTEKGGYIKYDSKIHANKSVILISNSCFRYPTKYELVKVLLGKPKTPYVLYDEQLHKGQPYQEITRNAYNSRINDCKKRKGEVTTKETKGKYIVVPSKNQNIIENDSVIKKVPIKNLSSNNNDTPIVSSKPQAFFAFRDSIEIQDLLNPTPPTHEDLNMTHQFSTWKI